MQLKIEGTNKQEGFLDKVADKVKQVKNWSDTQRGVTAPKTNNYKFDNKATEDEIKGTPLGPYWNSFSNSQRKTIVKGAKIDLNNNVIRLDLDATNVPSELAAVIAPSAEGKPNNLYQYVTNYNPSNDAITLVLAVDTSQEPESDEKDSEESPNEIIDINGEKVYLNDDGYAEESLQLKTESEGYKLYTVIYADKYGNEEITKTKAKSVKDVLREFSNENVISVMEDDVEVESIHRKVNEDLDNGEWVVEDSYGFTFLKWKESKWHIYSIGYVEKYPTGKYLATNTMNKHIKPKYFDSKDDALQFLKDWYETYKQRQNDQRVEYDNIRYGESVMTPTPTPYKGDVVGLDGRRIDKKKRRKSEGMFDKFYFGKDAYEKYGDKVSKALAGKTISKRMDRADQPGGIAYEAEQLGMDLYDLLETLEGMCYNRKATEIDDSTYLVYGKASNNKTESTWDGEYVGDATTDSLEDAPVENDDDLLALEEAILNEDDYKTIKVLPTRRNTWHNVLLIPTKEEAKALGFGLMYEDEEGSVFGIRDKDRLHSWEKIAFVPYDRYYDKYFDERVFEQKRTHRKESRIKRQGLTLKVEEANYGGAYDIDPEMFFTREDLNELRDSIEEYINLRYGLSSKYSKGARDVYLITDIDIDKNNIIDVTLEYMATGQEYSTQVKVDLRKVRSIRNFVGAYTHIIGDKLSKLIDEDTMYEESIDKKVRVTEQNKDGEVTVICYNRPITYKSRQDAIDFYKEAFWGTEGAEQERYSNVLFGLMYTDKDTVTDQEDDSDYYKTEEKKSNKKSKKKVLYQKVAEGYIRNKNLKEAITTYSKDSDEYKKLQAFCDKINSYYSDGSVKCYVDETYFDIGQDWMWTTVIVGTSDGRSYQINPADQEAILIGADAKVEKEIVENIKNLWGLVPDKYEDRTIANENDSFKEQLITMNPDYNAIHTLTDEDVKNVEHAIEVIESTRNSNKLTEGDIVLGYERGQEVKGVYEKQYGGMVMKPSSVPFVYIVGDKLGDLSISGSSMSVDLESLEYVGTDTQDFRIWGHKGATANGAIEFPATVNVWRAAAPPQEEDVKITEDTKSDSEDNKTVRFQDVHLCQGCGKPLSQCTCTIDENLIDEDLIEDLNFDNVDEQGFSLETENTLEDSVATWYIGDNPDDELGDDIPKDLTFGQVYDALKDGTEIYSVIGANDSIVRERVFSELSKILKVPYDDIYDLWLGVEESLKNVNEDFSAGSATQASSVGQHKVDAIDIVGNVGKPEEPKTIETVLDEGVEELSWDDLTDEEKKQATETYISIRETEEGRSRDEVNDDYPEPIDPEFVKGCTFFRNKDGYIEVNI